MANKYTYESIQTETFSSLVREGVYSIEFDHSPDAQNFFQDVMSRVLAELKGEFSCGLEVLDCGCGNGSWLSYLASMSEANGIRSFSGFDLTSDMVDTARIRLSRQIQNVNLKTGNIFEASSYKFSDSDQKYGLVFTYDVIQQLPKKLQFMAIESILENVISTGIAVIFDNDCESRFGRIMARKKFFTRYFRMNLVPDYYCNASYPPLAGFAEKLVERTGRVVSIEVSSTSKKRALIIRK